MSRGVPPSELDGTIESGGGEPATRPSGSISGNPTVDAGQPGESADRRPAAIRAGTQGNYAELVPVDPKHYVIGDEIARGGMGRILSARDRRLGRTVAIKELLAVTPATRARFDREARITARLQHPAIVNVLEAGQWPSSEPFYAMKLVAGESLDRAIAGATTLEERLALLPNVIAVVDALAYAHAQNVIHRDLKPSNVLVGAFGETVVIDWGLAKDLATPAEPAESVAERAASDRGETVAGTIVGTPAYMPPEQAEGEPVDQRADVYSLGAILYHTVSGQPPFIGKTAEDVLDKLLAGPAPSIATRVPALPRDLVAIIDKAMAYSPDDRYPTANELVIDLKKFQTGQLVGAHRYSGWQLVRRWIRRNRGAVVVAAIAMTLLVAFGITSIVGIMRERQRTEQQRAAAEQNRAQAEDLMNFMLGDLREKLEPVGKLSLLEVVARKALAYYAARPETTDPTELRGRATALVNIGQVFIREGAYEDARAQLDAALAIQRGLAAWDPLDPVLAAAIARTHFALGDLCRRQGKLDDAMREFDAMVVALEPLATRDPRNDAYRTQLALGLERIGWIEKDRGNLDAALVAFRRSLDVQRTLDPPSPVSRLAVSEGHDAIGNVLDIRGDLAGALAEYRTSAAIRAELVEHDPTNMRLRYALAASQDQIGTVLDERGDSAGALDAFSAEVRMAEYLTVRDATNAEWQDLLGLAKTRMGDILKKRGDLRGALTSYQEGEAIHQQVVARDPSNGDAKHHLAMTSDKLGYLLEEMKDLDGALAKFQASKSLREARSAIDPSNVQWRRDVSLSLDGIAEVQLAMGQREQALATYRDNLTLTMATAALDPANTDWQRDLALAHQRVGDILLKSHDTAGALAEFRASGAIFEALAAGAPKNSDNMRELANNHYKLGEALFERKDGRGSLAECIEGRKIVETLVAEDPANAGWLNDLVVGNECVGIAARALGDRATALTAYRAALQLAEKLLAINPADGELQVYVAELRRTIGAL